MDIGITNGSFQSNFVSIKFFYFFPVCDNFAVKNVLNIYNYTLSKIHEFNKIIMPARSVPSYKIQFFSILCGGNK